MIAEPHSAASEIRHMEQKTNGIRKEHARTRDLDDFDRKILGVLVRDATASYADLGREIGLSAPAVHERVKRMRRSGVIRQTSVLIDPVAIGKPFLAFIHVDVRGWCKTPQQLAIADFPEVEEVHNVAGDTSMLLKVRTENSLALEGLLARIYDVPGIVATRSYIVLSTQMERPVQPGSTKDWPPPTARRKDR
jgi:Lrp/AsnC family transcriptional regulator, leucine-responsive regulatory protein